MFSIKNDDRVLSLTCGQRVITDNKKIFTAKYDPDISPLRHLNSDVYLLSLPLALSTKGEKPQIPTKIQAHRELVVLFDLSFMYSPGKLEAVHVVDLVKPTRKCQTKHHYNEEQEIAVKAKRYQETIIINHLVICSRMFFLLNFRISTGTGSTLLIWRT